MSIWKMVKWKEGGSDGGGNLGLNGSQEERK